jgi:hypothetical protein
MNFGDKPPTKNNVENPQRESSPKIINADQIIWWSYFFSQGHIPLQRSLLNVINFIVLQQEPNARFDLSDNFPSTLTIRLSKIVRSGAHEHINTNPAENPHVTEELERLEDLLGNNLNRRALDVEGFKSEATIIIKNTLSRDDKFLVEQVSRDRNEDKRGFINDPFLSYFCYFLAKGREFEITEPYHRSLFQEIRKLLLNKELDLSSIKREEDVSVIRNIILKFNMSHPNDQVTQEELDAIGFDFVRI